MRELVISFRGKKKCNINDKKTRKIIPKNINLNEIDKSNPLEGGLKVVNGENMKEVYILPKKPAKLGFFEKMFHLFS